MSVVFVPGQDISQGREALASLTAGKIPKSILDMVWILWKCHSDGAFLEIKRVERGKPHERETQIMVGALSRRKWTKRRTDDDSSVDRWLPPEYEMKVVCSTKEQNMAYRTLLMTDTCWILSSPWNRGAFIIVKYT